MKDTWKKEYRNNSFYGIVHDALVWYGAILPGWRIRIDVITQTGYQFAMIDVSIWEPRKVNPSISWSLFTDTFRKTVDFSKSEFMYLH